jgi:L-threonylcarbamoyladenylate synthase
MRILPASPQATDEAISVLREGGIIAHATETCYGLACDLSNPQAVAKLFRVKDRPSDQPVSALFASIDDAKRYVEWGDRAQEYAKHLPGPLTLVLSLRKDAPKLVYERPYSPFSILHSPFRTLGIRISPHSTALALVSGFGSPISTTSANLHGKANPYSAEEIAAQFAGQRFQPDVIIDDGTLPSVPPSKVIDLTTENSEILRA